MGDIDRRLDPLSRHQTVIVGSRQKRPNLPSSGCPFCVGGLEAPEPYDVRWFPNRWPAMPDDRCEMVLFTPEHDLAFWELGTAGALKVVDLWVQRSEALGSRDDVDYVLVFENRGPAVGATIAHPHGQIYAYDVVPPRPLAELLDGVLDVPEPDDDMAVCGHGDWQAWVPAAASWPYELLIAPREPVGGGAAAERLTDPHLDRRAMAATLVDALARLDQVVDSAMPYMLWIHQRPFTDEDFAHQPVHVHVAPLWRAPDTVRFVASAELGGGIYFNPVVPADAAAALRACPGAT